MRNNPERIDEFAEARAVTKQKKRNLGIGELAEGFQDLDGFIDSLLGVTITKHVRPDRPPQKFEIAIVAESDVGREQAAVD